MAYITDNKYYNNDGTVPTNANWGSYQYVPFTEIVNNFLYMYIGDDKLINNVKRSTVIFHAKRAIQELNYDAFNSICVLEELLTDNLQMILPSDYVNYVRISLEKDGILFPLWENPYINYAAEYLRDNTNALLYDANGEVLEAANSHLDRERLAGRPSRRAGGIGNRYGNWGWDVDGVWYYGYGIGDGYFGLDTSQANINDTFRIDKKSGVINFSSGVSGHHVVLEYVSDGMEGGDVSKIKVQKEAEDAIYAFIKHAILDNKIGIQEYVVRRAMKEKTAKVRNAKIRLSNQHSGRLLMVLRGRAKWIK
jgi:hypothetical protein|tara:strand:- start:1916 stop:2839 length:924 start_codon:yes stop_codon:yes gene_type:complete